MTTTQTDEIKTWQQRLEETCPALGPMHIHACVEEVNDAMQAEIAELRSALQEQAREGEAVANSAILARGRFHAFKGEDAEPDDWEWFEEGTNCEHGCIDAVIVRADAIAAPQPAQPEQGELAGPDQIEKIVDRYVDEYEFTDGENAYHSPNEFEQMLIKDAFYGLLVDEEWDAAWGAHIASLQSAQPVALPLTPEELDLCRQWFNSIQDVNGGYLTPLDYVLAEKLYKQLNMRVPNSISEITKSGIGGAL